MKQIFIIIFGLNLLYNANAGIFNWFKSKPAWISKIDQEPLIEAFKPRGLRVSISDIDGMESFVFYGKLNECFGRNEVPAIEYKVTEPYNGRWHYINDNIELKEGDALHYWISVKVNNQEHNFPKKVKIIKNLVSQPIQAELPIDVRFKENSEPQTQLTNQNCNCPEMKKWDWKEPNVEQIICQYQIDSLTELVLHLLKDSKENKKLLLNGNNLLNSPKGSLELIRNILTNNLELYDLVDKIKMSEFTDCGILFEMSSIVDKKRIQLRALNDAKQSNNFNFIDPDVSECKIYNGNNR